MFKNIRYLYSMVTTLNSETSTLNSILNNTNLRYITYATNSAVASGNSFVEVTVPYAGVYLLTGYVCTNGTASNSAWLGGTTDQNNNGYLKILNYCSFAKIVETRELNTKYSLKNLNGATITPYTNMYISAILLKRYYV